MNFTNTVTIARSPADVFAYLAQFENVPRWNEAIDKTWKTSPGSVGVGSRFVQTRSQPSRGEDTFEVTEYEPDRKLSIDGTFGPFTGRFFYQLEPTGSSTKLTNDVDLEPSGLLRFAAPIAAPRIKSAVAKNLSQLKQILESA
jgi:uncharacterized protein YndB with AHSA1/START domain